MSSGVFVDVIVKAVSNACGVKIDKNLIEVPPDSKLGDYAFPCFSLAKDLRKNPVEIAKELAGKIKINKYLKDVKAEGPYLNFFVNNVFLAESVLKEIYGEKKNYGKKKVKSRTVLLEGWQPNTHKAFHIGHIRNAVLGDSIGRLLKFYGYKVVNVSYMGDVGAHIAKWLWYYKNFYRGKIPSKDVGRWAAKLYAEATKKADDNEKYAEEINEFHKRIEGGDKELIELWKKTRKLCLDDFKVIYKELGSKIDRWYFESEVEKDGIKMVKEMVENGYAEYSDGAIIINLEKYNLGVFVLLKSNGASLYSTKDIALAYLKSKEYNFDDSLYVVASEQDHHFRQLFKTLEIIRYKGFKRLMHVSYGVVKLKEGKMSSRLGNVVLYEEFRDKLIDKVRNIIKDRKLTGKKKEIIIKGVAFGAMNFAMLNQDSVKEIVFDYDQALSFDGETGPYIQYTNARCNSILKKYKRKLDSNVKYSLLDKDEEKKIIGLLNEFSDVVEKAALSYKPNLLTRYLIDLSQAFNQYYHTQRIIQEDDKVEKARILLVACVKQVLESGMCLIGIEPLEEM